MASYATLSDLKRMGGLPPAVLGSFSSDELQAQLDLATGIADDYLRSEYGIPFTAAPIGLKFRVARVAAYLLMSTKGFDPERGSDQLIVKGYNDAVEWFEKVSTGKIVLATDGDATPDVDEAAPIVLSNPSRRW